MYDKPWEVVVAGHICLDVIPKLYPRNGHNGTLIEPGQLVVVGPAVMSTGGAVSNTGLALHALGIRTLLMGKVGNDLFGTAILDSLRQLDPELADGMRVVNGEPTSYSVVISPPGVDRMFLHCAGTNDTFCASDVDFRRLTNARLFHFGYPPIMRRIYSDGGRELERILSSVRRYGMTTSLDMSMPDPQSESGRVDWNAFLTRVLPHVDIFMPSFEEILFMLDRSLFDRLKRKTGGQDMIEFTDVRLLSVLAGRLINMGTAVVGLKLGSHGLYLRTTNDIRRLLRGGRCLANHADEWTDRELLAPVFKVKVVGTTGSGDATIAGFIGGLVKGLSPEDAVTAAVAVGACNVEKADAVSGIPSWTTLKRRIKSGWKRGRVRLAMTAWKWNRRDSVWIRNSDSKVSQTDKKSRRSSQYDDKK